MFELVFPPQLLNQRPEQDLERADSCNAYRSECESLNVVWTFSSILTAHRWVLNAGGLFIGSLEDCHVSTLPWLRAKFVLQQPGEIQNLETIPILFPLLDK